MRIIRSPKLMQKTASALKIKKRKIGFVPTMGALHEGHLSLIRKARKENDIVIVSIFVNPAQFSPPEDLKRYPRPFKRDVFLCRRQGVDFIFYPSAVAMYGSGFRTSIYVEGLSSRLCGESRPAHFRGVTTVVAKLLNITCPDTVYLGQKDAQQAVIIKRMVKDLNFSLRIKVMPIIREKDGLAMSSRNIYLSVSQRKGALILWESLKLAAGLIKTGIRDSAVIIRKMRKLIEDKGNARIDYLEIVDTENLSPVKKIKSSCLLAVAAWIGKTRLIDNIQIVRDGSQLKAGTVLNSKGEPSL